MADQYKIVHESDIEHKNEYYEVRIDENTPHRRSIFFTTNEENLEACAAEIVATEAQGAQHWHVVPHLKH
jgi:hypothetical protein